ncbi:MAG: glycosyltransferase family 4 protein [Promethearchaeota archaeon]
MVTPTYYPIKGGAETVIQNLSIELNKMGVETDILTFNMNRTWNPSWQAKIEKTDGINIFKIPALNWFPRAHSDRITLGINLIPGRFRNRLKKYDIIHFHGGDLTFPLFSYTIKKPKLFHSHGLSLDFYKRYFLSRLILKNIADLYISISRKMQTKLMDIGIPKNKIRLLHNGIDTKTFHPSKEKKDNLVLFVGRITYAKGLHVLLESLRYLKNQIHLVIIGPSAWDVEYFRKILVQIENENKKGIHKITYLGAQEQTNIIKWYQHASVFVLPSFTEAFAVVNLEALACRTPVIATNVGGVPEVIQHGKNGILIPPNNVIKLAEAIHYLLDNEDIRARFGREGRKFVVENFSYSLIGKKLCRIYEEMLT